MPNPLTSSTPPGAFSSSTLAPIFVGGMPLDDLVTSLAVNSKSLVSQKQTTESQFWSTPQRDAGDITREVFEVSISTAKIVNSVAFDLARFPHKAHLFYWDVAAAGWKPVLGESRKPLVVSTTDSLPATITTAPPGATAHAQHYGAGHWVHHEFATTPITAAKFRLVLLRQWTDQVPVNSAHQPVPYSLGVRGFNIGYKVKDRKDVPRTNRHPAIITERESFASTTDILGSPVTISMRENRASDLLRGSIWKSEPQPVPNAVVCLYVDARTPQVEAQVVDRFKIDPITTGVHLNLYYSNDFPDQVRFSSSDKPLSYEMIRNGGTVSIIPSGSGLVFPDGNGYLDINNIAYQFNPNRPFWLGLVIQPQFDNLDTNRHVFLDTGVLRLEWTGDCLLATLADAYVLHQFEFSFNQQLSIAVSFDGERLRFYVNGQEKSQSVNTVGWKCGVPETSTLMTSLIRLGGSITGDDSDSGHGKFRLTSLILKPERPPGESTYAAFFSDPSAYVVEPQFASDSTGSTDTAILRYDPTWQTVGELSVNEFGFVGGPANRYEDMVWTPVARDYKLHKGTLVFNPVKAKYFKFEFTNLAPQTYDDYQPMIRHVKVFPTAQYYWRSNDWTASGNTAGGGAIVSQSADSTLHYSDQIRLYTNTRPPQSNSTYTPTQALYSQNPLVQDRLRDQSLYYNLQQWHLNKFCPRFVQIQRHIYEHIEIRHTARLAYYVGLNSLEMIRLDYAVDDDTEQYLESFDDTTNLEMDDQGQLVSGWYIADGDPGRAVDGCLRSPDSSFLEPYRTASKVFSSRRKVTGLSFASQQTPPVQLLPDPDFNNKNPLLHWVKVGDVKEIISTDDFMTDIGTMIKVERHVTANVWSGLEIKWASWQAIEDSQPGPEKPTWDDLEFKQADVTYGGVESIDYQDASRIGRMYAAARVYTTKNLSAPLYIQMVDEKNRVIAEEPFLPLAGQVSEWFCSVSINDSAPVFPLTWNQIEKGLLSPKDADPDTDDPNHEHPTWDEMEAKGSWDDVDEVSGAVSDKVIARLVQLEPTTDIWYVDNISIYDDAIVWEFSNDAGLTWYPVYDIRNDPNGCFMFPDSDNDWVGFGLRWRVTGGRPNQQINSLAIRPFYDSLPLGQPSRETMQSHGPNQSLCDHYPPIYDDPRWKLWHKPIPEDWFFIFRQWLLQQHPVEEQAPLIVVPDAIVPVDEGSPPVWLPLYLPDVLVNTEPIGD